MSYFILGINKIEVPNFPITRVQDVGDPITWTPWIHDFDQETTTTEKARAISEASERIEALSASIDKVGDQSTRSLLVFKEDTKF